ncbi:hypothetical protein KC799_05550 [candidate division KSB1 bacterium]|nr:hypothetical protein [candidate division KSB1 bacterium]
MNPADLDTRFDILLQLLQVQISDSAKFSVLCEFINGAQNYPQFLTPYLLEIQDTIVSILQNRQLYGIAPQAVLSFYETLRAVDRHQAIRRYDMSFEFIFQQLQNMILRSLLCLGEIEQAVLFLKQEWQTIPQDFFSSPPNNLDFTTKFEIIAPKYIEIAQQLKSAFLANELEKHLSEAIINFPVVEAIPNIFGEPSLWGGLRQLSIKIVGFSSTDEDELINNFVEVKHENGNDNKISIPLVAAKTLLSSTLPRINKKHFILQMTLSEPDKLHSGKSAGLAFAVGLYIALQNKMDLSTRITIPPNVAMTGEIDERGRVFPVAEESLKEKLLALFFSPIEILILPAQQFDSAQSILEKLHETYPQKIFTLFPINQLKEIFFDRRLVHIKKFSSLFYMSRILWQRRFAVLVTTLSIALSITGWHLFLKIYGPIDKNPVHLTYTGDFMLLKNVHDELIEEINPGKYTAQHHLAPIREGRPSQRYTFFDANEDGINELFWTKYSRDNKDGLSRIICTDVSAKTTLWEFVLDIKTYFPKDPATAEEIFEVQSLILGDYDQDQKPEIYLTATQGYFPALILKLDAQTGKLLAKYVNTGHLNQLRAFDLDYNGSYEILVTGINNSYNSACLIVLDPKNIAGYSPHTAAYDTPEQKEPGSELAYMLMSPSIIGKTFRHERPYNAAMWRADIKDNTNLISIILLGWRDAEYYINFDFKLRPVSWGTSTQFDTAVEDLLRLDKIAQQPDSLYWSNYMKSIRYWNGDDFQTTPAFARIF